MHFVDTRELWLLGLTALVVYLGWSKAILFFAKIGFLLNPQWTASQWQLNPAVRKLRFSIAVTEARYARVPPVELDFIINPAAQLGIQLLSPDTATEEIDYRITGVLCYKQDLDEPVDDLVQHEGLCSLELRTAKGALVSTTILGLYEPAPHPLENTPMMATAFELFTKRRNGVARATLVAFLNRLVKYERLPPGRRSHHNPYPQV